METKSRRLFNRREWPFFLLLVLAGAGMLFVFSLAPKGMTAVVEVDGRRVAYRELAQVEGTETLSVAGKDGIVLLVEFSPEGARVAEANCPDKTCQRTGWLTRAGESAVCLPGHVVLRLNGQEDSALNVDAATG